VFVLSAGRNLSSGTPAQMQRDPRVLEVYLGKRHAAVA
jgi:branched-chain amino acid transport system ATP-binding protein/neutral amino acid transport system ATP-binding protein